MDVIVKDFVTISDDNKNTFSDNLFRKQGTMSHITRLNGWFFFNKSLIGKIIPRLALCLLLLTQGYDLL